ncbi:hypothetical protein [Fredinandcohnia quinoae]|uniref:Uncharacterized protein n=1 Tax=Fredinandcohnia quinoae TaxID=2918902 RepID=A0AAW5EB47_9BACI|nr:hypothetical protein [Fredinandcohnia sp. SECRCQ15]MCH1626388.1 hypothetical protein [Fredinandcohnia sp. SECRCQ15]
MEERRVYLIFTDTGTLFTRLIKLYTKKRYNHVSLSFDHQLQEIFSFGRKKPYNPFIGGFVREKIDEGLFKKAKCEIYSFTISESNYNQMRMKVKQIEEKRDSYKYNLIGLFAVMLKYQLNRKNAFFCSQFVATILKEGQVVLDKSPCQCKPHDLLGIQSLKLIYRGKLHFYSNISEEKVMEKDQIFGNSISTPIPL